MRFLLSRIISFLKKKCLPTFSNACEVSSKSCWQHRHLLSEHLNTPTILFVNKIFVKILFRFGGCFTWVNLMFLKPLTLFSTSVFAPNFTKLYIYSIFHELSALVFHVTFKVCYTIGYIKTFVPKHYFVFWAIPC